MVNGYKTPFTSSKDAQGNHIYAKRTTLKELINLKSFDDELRYLLIKILTKYEEEIKTVRGVLSLYTILFNIVRWLLGTLIIVWKHTTRIRADPTVPN